MKNWDWNLFNAAVAVGIPLVGVMWAKLSRSEKRAEKIEQKLGAQIELLQRDSRDFHARLAVMEAVRLGKSLEEIDEILERKFRKQEQAATSSS